MIAATAQKASPKVSFGLKTQRLLGAGLMACVLTGVGACTNTKMIAQSSAPSALSAQLASLSIGVPVQGQLAAGTVQRWRVDVPAGSVVRGEIDATGLQLDVHNAQGQHVRRLLRNDGVGEGFTWLVQPGEQLVLSTRDQAPPPYTDTLTSTPKDIAATAHSQSTAPQKGQYRLLLQRSWAPAANQAVALPNNPLQSPRLQALAQQLRAGGSTDAFWRDMAAQGAPLVEPWSEHERLVTFVWRGAQRSVRLFGSPSGNHESLQRLVVDGRDSDVWWASFVMPSDVRISYAFAPDVPNIDGTAIEQRRSIIATMQRDPLNQRTWGAGEVPIDVYQGRSVLQLPDAPPQPWLAQRAAVPVGNLQRHWVTSAALGNGRDVWVYLPAAWAQTPPAQRALLLVFDAHAYLKDVPTPQIVDNLHADGLIPNTAVVLVANASSELRGVELPPNPAFARFMGDELMPWLSKLGVDVPAQRTVLAGSSYGGLASSYVALKYPQRFGNVLSLSGSYWWAPKGETANAMARWWAAAPLQDVRFYFDAGLYEGARGGQAGILETSRELGRVLRSKGYTVTQVEHSTGHDYVHWQGSIACGLVSLLNPQSTVLKHAACVHTTAEKS